MANWPGSVNSGTINLRVTNIATGTHYPGSAGSQFSLDWLDLLLQQLVFLPIIVNTEYATTDDVITVAFTTDEALSTDTDYAINGDISGVAISSNGSGTSWNAYNTVSTHAEGAVFAITFYDVTKILVQQF